MPQIKHRKIFPKTLNSFVIIKITTEDPLPDEIDITLTPRACEPLSTGRKGWDGVNLKFTRNTGLAALKGMIERKVKEIVPFIMKNNEKGLLF
jgi:hypothetical protein